MTNQQNIARRDEDSTRNLMGVLNSPMMKAALARAVPECVNPERITRIAMTAVRANPTLASCHTGSVIGALLQLAQLGLEPNTPLGHGFLVPFHNKKQGITVCTPIIGYKGMITLAQRSGLLLSLNAMVARQGDEFSYHDSFEPDFKFVRKSELKAQLTHAWCYGLFKSGGRFMVVLERQDVLARKARSPAARSGWSPWQTDEAAMWRKTAVRAAQWQLPQTPEQQRAIVLAKAEDGEVAWLDAYDPEIAAALDEAHMLPPEPDLPESEPAGTPAAPTTDPRDDDLSR